jgi:pyridoxine 5-phosphate synthase
MINSLKLQNIRVTLFIDPKLSDIKIAKELGADCVEIHTGKYCNAFNSKKNIKKHFLNIKKAAQYSKYKNLEVHAGHGLTYKSVINISKIQQISEFNIGHFIISESIFCGLKNSIKKFKKIINK